MREDELTVGKEEIGFPMPNSYFLLLRQCIFVDIGSIN